MEKIEQEQVKKKIVAYHRVSPTKHDRIRVEDDKRPINDIIKENMQKSIASSIELCRRKAESTPILDENGNTILDENGEPLCEKIEYDYIDEYKSGSDQKNMVQFQQLMADAKAGKISKIYIRRVNRFGRNTKQSMQSMIELDELGIPVVFVENGIDTSKPFMKPIMMMFVELASQEREALEIARIEGIEKAKVSGVVFGQPRKEINVNMLRTERLKPPSARTSWKKLEQDFKCSRSTLISRLKEAGYWDSERRCVI